MRTTADEHAALLGNPGAPPAPTTPTTPTTPRRPFPKSDVIEMYMSCVLCWAAFGIVTLFVSLILDAQNTTGAIELCPPVANVSNTTSVTLSAASTCNPVIDTQRLQDVIGAERLGFITGKTVGITCDITWQEPTAKFNESCTEFPLQVTLHDESESTLDVKAWGGGVYPTAYPTSGVRMDAIEWNSYGKAKTLISNLSLVALIAVGICCCSVFGVGMADS